MIVETIFLKYLRQHWILIVINPAEPSGPRIYYVDPLSGGQPGNRPDMLRLFNR